MPDPVNEKEDHEKAVHRYVAKARPGWLSNPGIRVSLCDAHMLLSDGEVEQAVTEAMLELGREITGRACFYRDDNGQCLIPRRIAILEHLRQRVTTALCD